MKYFFYKLKKAKNKISVLFFLTALILLSYALYYDQNNMEQKDKYFGHLDREDQTFSDNLFSSYFNFKDYDGVLLFVVASEFCSTCINEIIEYTIATTEYLNSSLNEYKIFRYALIVGDNKSDYNRVNNLLKFPFSSSLVLKKSKLASILHQWNRGITGFNQIILIDPTKNKVMGRIGVYGASTPPYFKKNLVQEVLFELEN